MGAFTKPTEKDVNQILSLYGFEKLKSFKPLGHGISNSNFKVELENRNILLKISDDKGETDILDEINLLNFLKSKKFPFSIYPIKRPNGEFIYHYKNKVGVIFEFIEGKIPQINDVICQKIGQALGLLHQIKGKESLRSYESVGFGPLKILNYLDQKSCPEDFKKIFQEIFPDNLKNYLSQKFEEGFIHGDLYFDNTLFDNGDLKVILDFEQAGIGPYILDLGISISGSCLKDGKIYKKLMTSYILGYETNRKLAKEEKTFLNDAVCLGLFSISLWRIKRFKEGNLDPSRKESYKELLLMAKDFKNES
jgi:homoserine kinase type II